MTKDNDGPQVIGCPIGSEEVSVWVMLLNSPADLLQVPVKCRPCQSGQALTLDILNAGRTSTWRCTQCAQNQCCPTHALIAFLRLEGYAV